MTDHTPIPIDIRKLDDDAYQRTQALVPWNDDDEDDDDEDDEEADPDCMVCGGEGGWRELEDSYAWVECPDCFPPGSAARGEEE